MATTGNQKGKRMWPSLATANQIADWANIFFIGSLVVGVVSTVLIVWMANVKEGYWERARQESDERMASLVTQGDQLRKDTAEANVRAAEANERTANLEKEALQLRNELNKRLVRTLPAEDKATLISELSNEPKGRVFVASTGHNHGPGPHSDVDSFGQEIRLALYEAGYNCSGSAGKKIIDPAGLSIWVSATEPAPRYAESIVRAFSKIGLTLAQRSCSRSDPECPLNVMQPDDTGVVITVGPRQ